MDRAEKLFEERLEALNERESSIKEQEDRLKKWTEELAEKEATSLEKSPTPKEQTVQKVNTPDKKGSTASQNSFMTAHTAEGKVPEVKEETAGARDPYRHGERAMDQTSLTTITGGLDNWSETASTFIDTKQRSEAYKREIPVKESQMSETSGLPYVKFAAPDKVEKLTYHAISTFVHDFTNLKANVPSLSACGLLAKDVADSLLLRGIIIRDSNSIMRYFSRHLQQFEKLEKKRTLKNLKNKLRLNAGAKNPIEQIYHFFDEVLKLLKSPVNEAQDSRTISIVSVNVDRLISYKLRSIEEYALTADTNVLAIQEVGSKGAEYLERASFSLTFQIHYNIQQK
eukprot:augustus_masked-scaffold_32-processed-gene-2.48-mRNA-1 protein AED:1.00 eAED:1.00 QI:0/0/0/0/1/1/2/0/341